MFKKIINSIYKFGDFVENKVNSIINYFDDKLYRFNNRKELAKKVAIIINGFKECPGDTISIAYCPKFTGDQKIAAFIIYDNEVKEGRMFDSVTALNEWFELICSGDDKYCYPNEEIHG